MANEADVFAFEKHFLAALKTILTFDDVQTLTFGDPDNHATPRIEIGFQIANVNDVDRAKTEDNKLYLQLYVSTATIQIFSSREKKAEHLELVGKVRNALAYNTPLLVPPTLPDYYQVKRCYEQQGESGRADTEDDFEITTVMPFQITFGIQRSAFDAP